MNSAQIKAMVEDEFEELVKIRRDLHMHPELSEHEERTEKAICAQLDKLGIPYEAGVAGHGIIATVGPKDAKYGIAIRAEGRKQSTPLKQLFQLKSDSRHQPSTSLYSSLYF